MIVHWTQNVSLSFSKKEGMGAACCQSRLRVERGKAGEMQGRSRKGDTEEQMKRKSKNDKNLLKATIHSSWYKMKHYYSCLDKTSNKVSAVSEQTLCSCLKCLQFDVWLNFDSQLFNLM